jgi:phi13 family phage major tail protein
MSNYKSYVGVDNVYYAPVTQDDAALYAADTPAYLAPIMNISMEPAAGAKVQYADNQPFDAMVAEGETKITCEITGMDSEALATILGMTYDVASARVFDNGGVPPYVALGFRAMKADGSYRYYWFLKGRFMKPKEEIATKADTPDIKTVKLEFAALKTIYHFELVDGGLTDGVKRVFGETSDDDFDETSWFDEVQVPSAGSLPAFTLTPVPADNATGIVGTAPITLTFSNPIVTGTDGIILMKATDRSLPTATYVISATYKVVTITPGSALTAGAIYFISVADVTSVYGQKLTDTVLKFTVAS